MKLKEVEIKLSTGLQFKLLVDNETEKNIEKCLDNWLARTGEFTQQSMCDYINSKSHMGTKAVIPKNQ